MKTEYVWCAVGAYYLAINVVAFLIFYVDKRRSIAGKWRVRESQLLKLAAFGGGVGAYLAMRRLHHKSRKLKFRIWIPLMSAFHVAGILYLAVR